MREEIKQRIEAVRGGEVPLGYKRTDSGVMPEEWPNNTLGKIIEFHNEKSTINNEYPVLTSARSGLVFQTEYFEDQVTREENAGYNIIPYGYVTYRSRSDDGRFTFNRNQIIEKGIVSCFYPVFRIIEELADPSFVLSYLNNFLGRQILKGIVGTSQLVLSEKKLSELRFPCPNLAEQEKIAEILSTCDRIIELKQQLLEEKRRQKRCFMQRIFKTNGWEKKKLSELADVDTGDADTQDKVSDGKYPFFVRSATIERIDSYSYDGEAILTPGDGKIGEIFHYYNGKFNYHQRVYKISDFHGCLGKYIYYYLQLFFKKRACLMTAKATVDSLRREMLTDMPIFFPSVAEQERIVCLLDGCEKEIELLEKSLECEELKKKALMQLLLTGLVRVNA